MDASEFRRRGKEMVDYLATYMDTLGSRRVTPEVEPGYLRNLLPAEPPRKGEDFDKIMKDVDRAIMPGITHWQHPNFHAYFPAGNSFPSVLGDMLSDVIGCIGFSWAASPACTELEMLVCDWVGKMIGFPPQFLHESGEGGGVIQGSASECVLVTLLAARHVAIQNLRVRLPFAEDCDLLSKLVAYSSKLAHSCVEKAGMIGFVKMRQLEVDDDFALRGHILEDAIEEDRRLGLIPFYVCATVGTTACCSFDNVEELGQVCARENIWLHVDAAYAGNALICPEFRYLIKGIENCKSFNFNTNKWMQVNFDCSLMWVHSVDNLTSALTVDPLYLQHKHGNNAIDLRHWGIPLSRRFRALKLWFVLRMYGVEGLQRKIREQVRLAKMFEEKVLDDDRFEVHGNVTMGLVCFRLQGPNTQSIKLLKMINESGKLHMVPALLNELYVIRFAICAQDASADDVIFAWGVISATATEMLAGRRRASSNNNPSTVTSGEPTTTTGVAPGGAGGGAGVGVGVASGRAGRSSSSFESISESPAEDEDDKEVFDTDFDDEFVFDHQRCHVRRAHKQRNIFFRMVSDPKSYQPRLARSLDARLRSHSLGSPSGAWCGSPNPHDCGASVVSAAGGGSWGEGSATSAAPLSGDHCQKNGAGPLSGDHCQKNGAGPLSGDHCQKNGAAPLSGDHCQKNGAGPENGGKGEGTAFSPAANGTANPDGPRSPAANGTANPGGPRSPTANGTRNPDEPQSPTTNGTTNPDGPRSPTANGTRNPDGPRSPTTNGTRNPDGPRSPTTNGTRNPDGPRSPTTNGTTNPGGPRSPITKGTTTLDGPRSPTTNGTANHDGPRSPTANGTTNPGGPRSPITKGTTAVDRPRSPITDGPTRPGL